MRESFQENGLHSNMGSRRRVPSKVMNAKKKLFTLKADTTNPGPHTSHLAKQKKVAREGSDEKRAQTTDATVARSSADRNEREINAPSRQIRNIGSMLSDFGFHAKCCQAPCSLPSLIVGAEKVALVLAPIELQIQKQKH